MTKFHQITTSQAAYIYPIDLHIVRALQSYSLWVNLISGLCFSKQNLIRFSFKRFKGSDRQCMVIELRFQYHREFFQDSFETYQTFLRCRCIFVQQGCKFNIYRDDFENGFQINYSKTTKKNVQNFYSKIIRCLGTYLSLELCQSINVRINYFVFIIILISYFL